MHIYDVKTIYSGSQDGRRTALLSFELVFNPATPDVRIFDLLAVVSTPSRDGERSIRQLYRFDPGLGLQLINENLHPFVRSGTPDERQKKYREVVSFIKEWLQNEPRILSGLGVGSSTT